MDSTAVGLLEDTDIDIRVFNMADPRMPSVSSEARRSGRSSLASSFFETGLLVEYSYHKLEVSTMAILNECIEKMDKTLLSQ